MQARQDRPEAAADGAADAALVCQCLGSDASAARRAFGTLVVRHEGHLRPLLRGLTRNPALADDLAQEAFIKAWKGLSSLSHPERFGAWLKRIAYREFLHAVRRRRLETDYLEASAQETMGHYEGLELSETLRQVLGRCSEEEAELLILIYGFEFSFAEVAAQSGVSEGTLKSRLHRVKEKLRKLLEDSHVG